ncbi:MAG: hypothetical protein WBO35_03765 [Candidatus Saccharimonadales bacterium]
MTDTESLQESPTPSPVADYSGFAADDDAPLRTEEPEPTAADDLADEAEAEADADPKIEAQAEPSPEPATEEPAKPEPSAPAIATPTEPPSTQGPRYSEQDYANALTQTDQALDALAAKYEDGEINFKAYRTEERKLNDQRAALQNAMFGLQNERERGRREWESAVADFRQDPANALFDGALAPLLREQLQLAWADSANAGKSHAQMLKESATAVREQMRTMLGIAAEIPASAPPPVADELQARRAAKLKAAEATPAKGTRAPSVSNPWEGWAAAD